MYPCCEGWNFELKVLVKLSLFEGCKINSVPDLYPQHLKDHLFTPLVSVYHLSSRKIPHTWQKPLWIRVHLNFIIFVKTFSNKGYILMYWGLVKQHANFEGQSSVYHSSRSLNNFFFQNHKIEHIKWIKLWCRDYISIYLLHKKG